MKLVYVVLSKLKYGDRDSEIDSAYADKAKATAYAKECNDNSTLFKFKVQKVPVV